MSDTIQNNSRDQGLIAPRDNNLLSGGKSGSIYAVRGIGAAGLDLVATTVAEVSPALALNTVMLEQGSRADAVRAWVVTLL